MSIIVGKALPARRKCLGSQIVAIAGRRQSVDGTAQVFGVTSIHDLRRHRPKGPVHDVRGHVDDPLLVLPVDLQRLLDEATGKPEERMINEVLAA